MASYGARPCPNCGETITTNALGRATHMRSERCWLNELARSGKFSLLPRGTRYIGKDNKPARR